MAQKGYLKRSKGRLSTTELACSHVFVLSLHRAASCRADACLEHSCPRIASWYSCLSRRSRNPQASHGRPASHMNRGQKKWRPFRFLRGTPVGPHPHRTNRDGIGTLRNHGKSSLRFRCISTSLWLLACFLTPLLFVWGADEVHELPGAVHRHHQGAVLHRLRAQETHGDFSLPLAPGFRSLSGWKPEPPNI